MSNKISQFLCPNCGASIPFDSNAQKLKCAHCNSEFDIGTLESFNSEAQILQDDYSWSEHKDEQIKDDGKKIYVCPSCGGEVVGDESMAASACPYCGNSVIIASQFEGMLKPDVVIPFKYSKDQALAEFKKFASGKALLPRNFINENTVKKLNGMYVPYWLFDCDSSCSARYKTTRVSTHMMGDYEITETRHYLVYRDGNISFNNVPVDASKKLTPELLEALEPFDFSEGKDFNTAYLSGFFADKYEEDKDEAIKRANERIAATTSDAIDATVIGYVSIIPTSRNVRFEKGTSRYALLPIYLFNTQYKGKTYTFAMNGQTGKIVGDLPSDSNRFWTYLLSVLAISFIVIFLIMYFIVK